MYCYVVDPAVANQQPKLAAQIRAYLQQLGIAGEFAVPRDEQSVAQVVTQAMARNYRTIVAVGATSILDDVVAACAGTDVVVGYLPISKYPGVKELVGTTDWKAAADALRRRRYFPFQPLKVGDLATCFPVSVSPCLWQLETDSWKARTTDPCALMILPDGEGLRVSEMREAGGFFRKSVEPSRFWVPRLRVSSTERAELQAGEFAIGVTPVEVTLGEPVGFIRPEA